MPTLKDRADGLALWVTEVTNEGENVADIVDRLVAADRGALFWQIAQMVLPRDQVDRIEHMAAHLISRGYNPDPDEFEPADATPAPTRPPLKRIKGGASGG